MTAIILALVVICGMLIVLLLVASVECKQAAKTIESLRYANPYARMLGQTVEARVYEGSKWERMVVVAVSWHGAVAVRPLSDLATKARWIHKSKVPTRVREIQQ